MNLAKKLIDLRAACVSVIGQLVSYYGIDSEFQSDKCLKILDDSYKYNLDSDRFAVEVTENVLLDNDGHHYDHTVIGTEKLCDLTMYLVKTWDRKNIITFDKGTESDKDAALAMAWDYLSKDMSHRPDFGDVITSIRKARE